VSTDAPEGTSEKRTGPGTERPPHRALASYFETHDVAYRFVERQRRLGGEDHDASAAEAPANGCRAVLLRTERGWRLAVIPSGERLDLGKTRMALREPRLRLASESESGALFPEFEPGRLPPIGPHYPHPDVLDERLLAHNEVLCEAGHAERRLAIDPHAIVDLAGPAVADVCRA
jgi:Ala-tRNA(Pro) deacylase